NCRCLFMCVYKYHSIFFFQAEDGIRDPLVTGVQTCALPISGRRQQHPGPLFDREARMLLASPSTPSLSDRRMPCSVPLTVRVTRSEERRVGKEWWRRGARE